VSGPGYDSDHTGLTQDFNDILATVGREAEIVQEALNQWASVSGLINLGQVVDGGGGAGAPGTAGLTGDIRVASWEIISGNVLAHTFFPWVQDLSSLAGDIHFDSSRNWVDSLYAGAGEFDFYTVVLHEMGHALGLSHSSVPGSVMYSSYSGVNRTLQADDVAGIQALYGPAPIALTAHMPEPGTYAMLACFLISILLIRSKRQSTN
jgi:hypothetical protein